MKRNAQKVPTTLGGGQNGYLGLVLSPVVYNRIINARPFIRPQDPGPFTPTARREARVTRMGAAVRNEQELTAEDITMQKIQHDERLRLFNECQAVESTLRTQIIEAIEEDYLTSLRDPHTDMIHHSIPRIFNFLKINYGQVSPQQLKQRETEMDNVVYDPSSHVNSVFNKLQEFQDIYNLVDQPK